MKIVSIFFAIPLFLFLPESPIASVGAAAPLTPDKMRSWEVVVDTAAIPPEQYAAEEFCRLFRMITGADLKRVSSTTGSSAIYIGGGAAWQEQPQDLDLSSLGDEGFHIRIGRNTIAIIGARPRGTLYGVYEFFERYLGVRFLTSKHTYIPPNAAALALPIADYRYIPPFSFRWAFFKENFVDHAFATRMRTNTVADEVYLGGKTPHELITHSILNYLPVSKYGVQHPEFYALVDGSRKLDVGSGGPQVCSSHPEVIRIITYTVDSILTANPSMKSISISQMDNNFFCECPSCAAINKKEESPGAAHLTLVNAVAENIDAAHPDVKIGTLVYWYTRKPPKAMELQPNVEIMLCSIECCTLHALDDPHCSKNRVFTEDLGKWKQICRNILAWNYNTNFATYDLPFPNLNVIAANIRFFQRNGIEGIFMQAAGNGLSSELSDLRNYVICRCLWHPEQESWKLVEEFCRLHYHAAAPAILEYLQFLHQHAEAMGVHPNCFPKPIEVGLDQEIARKLLTYFYRALTLASNEVVRKRVEKAMIPVLKALLVATPLVYDKGVYRLDTSVGSDILDRYITLTKEHGMDMVSETMSVNLYIRELLELKKGVPAVKIENQVWKMVILPEQRSRIAELIHKPTGRRIVNHPPPGFTHPERPKNKTSWQVRPDRIVTTQRLSEGSTWQHIISFPSSTDAGIRVDLTFTAGVMQLAGKRRERPMLYLNSGSSDPGTLQIFIKDQRWLQVNTDWQMDREIIFDHGLEAGGGTTAYGFYDSSEKFGIVQTFARGSFDRFRLFWHPGRKELGLDMFPPARKMKKGDQLSYSYNINWLNNPPVEF